MAKELSFLPKDIPKYKARVLGKEEREFYEEVFTKTAEKYGKNSLAYKSITNGIDSQNATGSSFLFNTEAGLYLKSGRILNLEDIDNIIATDKNFFDGFYTDTNELVLRSDKDSYEKNQLIINSLKKELKSSGYKFSPENPLVLTNPELIPDKKNPDKGYGLIAKLGKNTKIRNDERLAHGKNKINLGNLGNLERNLYATKNNGLSRIFLDRYGNLYVWGDNLGSSVDYGRVVAVFNKDAKGVAPKIFEAERLKLKENYLSSLNKLKEEIDSEIERNQQNQ